MQTQYLSKDGKIFDSEYSCAEYELATFGSILEAIEREMAKVYPPYQKNWCGSGSCACMGCINREFFNLGLTKNHWQVWFEKYRPIHITDGVRLEHNHVFGLKITGYNTHFNKTAFITYLKKQYSLTSSEAFTKTKIDAIIVENLEYMDTYVLSERFIKHGLITEIIRTCDTDNFKNVTFLSV